MIIDILMLALVALVWLAASISMSHTKRHIGNVTTFEDDQHYQLIPIGIMTESAANTFTTTNITRVDDAVAAAWTQARNGLGVEMVVNAFGRGNHGLSCWDVMEFLCCPNVDIDVDPVGGSELWTISSGDAPTVEPPEFSAPNANQFVAGSKLEALINEVTAVGENLWVRDRMRDGRWAFPTQIIEGNSLGHLLTEENYHVSVLGISQTNAINLHMAMYARRVLIELNEVFFDRGDVRELLNAVLLQGLLN